MRASALRDKMDIAYSVFSPFSVEMTSAQEILELTLSRFPLPSEIFSPDGTFWLTLYLFGDPIHYRKAKPALEAIGWQNLCSDSDFAGFSYPKKEVRNDVGQVRDVLESAIETCHDTSMGICAIDVDTAFDPQKSTFKPLFEA